MTLSVGVIDYINVLPFYAAFFQGVIDPEVRLVSAVPSELNRKLYQGELDLSPISSAEYLSHGEHYELLPEFCVGARMQVDSVCLYHRGSLQDLHEATIACTPQSASGKLLVKVLCHRFWQVRPKFKTLESIQQIHQEEAFLLIGDPCLELPSVPGFHRMDLAQAWFHATGLPFTFALFAVRREVAAQHLRLVEQFQAKLRQSLQWASDHPEEILKLAQQRCSKPLSQLRHYYNNLFYTFDELQQKALDRFALLAKET